jgi:hypothetical protein
MGFTYGLFIDAFKLASWSTLPPAGASYALHCRKWANIVRKHNKWCVTEICTFAPLSCNLFEDWPIAGIEHGVMIPQIQFVAFSLHKWCLLISVH